MDRKASARGTVFVCSQMKKDLMRTCARQWIMQVHALVAVVPASTVEVAVAAVVEAVMVVRVVVVVVAEVVMNMQWK